MIKPQHIYSKHSWDTPIASMKKAASTKDTVTYDLCNLCILYIYIYNSTSVNFMKGDVTPWLPPLRYLFCGYDVCYLCRVAGANAKQHLVMDML